MEKSPKRIVDNTQSFPLVVVYVANRLVSSHDVRGAMSITVSEIGAVGGVPQIGTEAASSLVQNSIQQELDDGRIVVINDSVNLEIIGLRKVDEGLEVLRIPRRRYKTVMQGDEERRIDLQQSHRVFRNPAITTAFHSDGQMEFRITDHGELKDEDREMVLHIPGTMQAGQQVVIASVWVEIKEKEFDEVDQEYEEIDWIVESRKEVTTGKMEYNMREHIEYKEYKRRKVVHKKVLKDDGFILLTSQPTDVEVLAVNGLHDGPGSYLRPSGWFIAGKGK
ncbi:MAG: hypothetical protein HY428_01575 [Candidatus Levybacteria bacterium]|nr:hypothetical protein [Candidatus Levybacteria bacterium]